MGSETSQAVPAAAQGESKSFSCSKVKVLGCDVPGEPRQGSSRREVSLVAAPSVIKYSGAAQELAVLRVNYEKRTWERRSMDMARGAASVIAVKLLEKLIDEIFERSKRKREAKASNAQESLMKKDFQDLIQQMKAMHEDFQKGQESRKTEERNTPEAQRSGMEETFQQLVREMKAMREDFQEGLTSTKRDIQLLREDLNKELDRKMKKMARAQESKMDKKFQQLCQRIQTLEQELHGRQGSNQHILQLLRAEMEMEQGVLIESASEDEGSDIDA